MCSSACTSREWRSSRAFRRSRSWAFTYENREDGGNLVFVAYGSAGVGARSGRARTPDAVPARWTATNPVTFAFGSTYAFARTIVSLNDRGHFRYTPTIAYGGNNGRSVLLAPNGLYYAVGNANSSNAAQPSARRTTQPGRHRDLTGLEDRDPHRRAHLERRYPRRQLGGGRPAPRLQVRHQVRQARQGRQLPRHHRVWRSALLPRRWRAQQRRRHRLRRELSADGHERGVGDDNQHRAGLPLQDSAKATGGNYTPFAVFFANATTMYVTDEGSGNATDTSTHAGLEKWSLVDGVWQLDYVLTKGLIGTVDSNLDGHDGPWPDVTTIGLRNMTGIVHEDKVTIGGRDVRRPAHRGRQRRRPQQDRGDHRRRGRHDRDERGDERVVPRCCGTDLRRRLSRSRLRQPLSFTHRRTGHFLGAASTRTRPAAQ